MTLRCWFGLSGGVHGSGRFGRGDSRHDGCAGRQAPCRVLPSRARRRAASGAQLRAHLWDTRQQAPALCLYLSAIDWAGVDRNRALRLHVLGMVRAQYEHGLCREWPKNEVSSVYAAMRMASGQAMQGSTPDEAKDALREMAGPADALTYEPTTLAQLCGSPAAIRSREEWSGVAAKLLTEARASAEAP